MKKIIIIAFVIILILVFGVTIGKVGFGTGNGSEKGNQVLDSFSEEKQAVAQQDQEVVIRIDENKIYVGEEECTDIEDLKDRIVKINSQGNTTQYALEHEYAIKATYDEVVQVLFNLEETLGISIDYRE